MEASTPTILLVEDSPTDADLIQRVFQRSQLKSWNLTWVERLGEAVDYCGRQVVDLILLDLQLPDSEGVETVRTVRSQVSTVPIVVLTNSANEEMGVQAVTIGAQDYLVKDQITIQVLFRTVKYALERSRILQQLQTTLAEKDTLLAEVQHRVKNTLQLISSLINLQIHQESDDHTVQLFKALRSRIHSIATVYEMLYQGNRIDQINLANYLEALLKHLLVGEPGVKGIFRADIAELTLDVSRATACGLILTELVTNALKHAFRTEEPPVSPTIQVCLNQIGHTVVLLEVQDNGVGVSPGKALDSFEGMGLSLVQALTHQLTGSLSVDSSQGTHYRIQFPALEGDR